TGTSRTSQGATSIGLSDPMTPAAQPPSGYTASSAATPVASSAATTTGRSPVVNPVSGSNGDAATSAMVPVPATRPAASVALPGDCPIQRRTRVATAAVRASAVRSGSLLAIAMVAAAPTTPMVRPA